MRIKLLAAIALLAPLPAFAQAMQPGMWDMSIVTEMPGMPASTDTDKRCLTKEELADNTKLAAPQDSGCSMIEQSRSGSSMKFKMSCSGEVVSGSLTSTSTTFVGVNEFQIREGGQVMAIKNTVSGKRVGDCK